MSEGSWVGLDVHARSVVAGVIDGRSGEVRSLRLPPGCAATVAWLQTLPPPVKVVYEAGADWVQACARVCRRKDQLRCRGTVADPVDGRSGQDRPAGRRAAGEAASAG
jgi:hypothetical protein